MTPHRRHWLLSLLSLLTAGTWDVGCHKLENYMDGHSYEVIPSSASSLSKRQPRLFYRSTSTVTVSTTITPACWSDSSLTTTCATRKKRSGSFIIDDPMDPYFLGDPLEPFDVDISPSKSSKFVSGSETLRSSNAADSGSGSHRDPRFIFYLSTTTTTTTSTSLASTTTFTLLGCIPLEFSYTSCA